MSSVKLTSVSGQRVSASALHHSASSRRSQQHQHAIGASKTHHLQLVVDPDTPGGTANSTGMEEDSTIPTMSQTLQVRPGKRGGRYLLPEDGCLTIPEAGGFGRNDSVTVTSVQPSELQLASDAGSGCCVKLGELEALVSPVYRLESSVRNLRCELRLRLPLRLPVGAPGPFSRLRLMHRASGVSGSVPWRELTPTCMEADKSSISVETRSVGLFLMLLSPLEEAFQISPSGGLVDFRLDQSVGLRVPKNAFPVARLFRLSILPFTDEGVALVRQLRRSETMDIGSVSPMYSFRCDDDHDHCAEDKDSAPMKRGVTIKLPMPAWLRDADRKDAQARVAIAFRTDGGKWNLLDTKHASVRLTRNTVSFESKQLAARFCFLDAPQPRLPRAVQGLEHMEVLNAGRPGRMAMFAALDRRRWALCVRCAPADSPADDCEAAALRWQPLPPLQPTGARVERAVRAARPEQLQAAQPPSLLLHEGDVITIQLTGDFQLVQNAGGQPADTVLLQYHQRFADRPAVFDIVPTERTVTIATDFFAYLLELTEDDCDRVETTEGKLVDKSGNETLMFRGSITVSTCTGEQLSTHEFSVGFHALKQYLDLKPPPPSPPPPQPSDADPCVADAAVSGGQQQQPDGQKPWLHYPRILKLRIYELDPQQAKVESQQRLLAPRRNAAQPTFAREPRVLSRRSLQCLAERMAQQSVSLAAELGLTESAVSALGFETLSNRPGGGTVAGSGGGGFAFRVLLYWKRSRATPERGCGLAERLVDALTRLQRPDLVGVVRDCLAGNLEVTPERFGK